MLPVVGAGWDKLTLHVALPGAITEDGLQVSDCNVIGVDVGVTLIVPPVAVLGIVWPASEALTEPVTPIGTAPLNREAAS